MELAPAPVRSPTYPLFSCSADRGQRPTHWNVLLELASALRYKGHQINSSACARSQADAYKRGFTPPDVTGTESPRKDLGETGPGGDGQPDPDQGGHRGDHNMKAQEAAREAHGHRAVREERIDATGQPYIQLKNTQRNQYQGKSCDL